MSESELRDQLVVLLSGRAAEKLIYDEVTVGAENDLERATESGAANGHELGHEPATGTGLLQGHGR